MDNTSNRKLLILAGIGCVILLLIIALVATTASKKPTASPTPSSSATPSPDAVQKGPAMPKFSGFDPLQDSGISSNQLDAVKYGFFKYSKSINKHIDEVTLSSYNVVPHNRYSTTTTDTINITVSLDSTSANGRIEYDGFYAARLYLSTTPAFDSGTIDLFHGVGNQD
jgi:hypothetical protein